jgi:hypothetical protein
MEEATLTKKGKVELPNFLKQINPREPKGMFKSAFDGPKSVFNTQKV